MRLKIYRDFCRLRAKEAALGTISRANAMAGIPGAALLLAFLWFWGLNMDAPKDVVGTLALAVAFAVGSTALAWIAIFTIRWFGAPARLDEELRK